MQQHVNLKSPTSQANGRLLQWTARLPTTPGKVLIVGQALFLYGALPPARGCHACEMILLLSGHQFVFLLGVPRWQWQIAVEPVVPSCWSRVSTKGVPQMQASIEAHLGEVMPMRGDDDCCCCCCWGGPRVGGPGGVLNKPGVERGGAPKVGGPGGLTPCCSPALPIAGGPKGGLGRPIGGACAAPTPKGRKGGADPADVPAEGGAVGPEPDLSGPKGGVWKGVLRGGKDGDAPAADAGLSNPPGGGNGLGPPVRGRGAALNGETGWGPGCGCAWLAPARLPGEVGGVSPLAAPAPNG